MEVAGLAFGAIGLAGQLLMASQAGYDILSNAGNVGSDVDKFAWRLQLEKVHLDRWANETKLGDPEYRQMHVDNLGEETLNHIVGRFSVHVFLW
jgi:hypothetical protein